MFSIDYHSLDFHLVFEKALRFKNLPTFYFRSILGKELHRITCLFRNKPCSSCPLRFQCAYSVIFESPVKEENEVLKGRNYASHPFILFTDAGTGQDIQDLRLNLVLIGESTKYLPYLFLAIKSGGEKGIFKSRVRYEIKNFSINNYIGLNGDKILIPPKRNDWSFESDGEMKHGKFFIEFLSPFRYKKQGKYVDQVTLDDILLAIYRRLEILNALYVRGNQFGELTVGKYEIESVNDKTDWQDFVHYSARQKTTMRLGGITGIMALEGTFDSSVLSLLKAGEIFHIGKNTSLGLGKIKVTFVEGE